MVGWTNGGDPPLSAAELRVLGGLLIGIGVGPLVVGALLVPIDRLFGETAAELSRPAIHLFAVVFGAVALEAVRLFYARDWRSTIGGRAN